MTNIQNTKIVGGHTYDKAEQAIAAAVLAFQNQGLTVEIQYAGKQSGYYNALVIGRAVSWEA